MASVLVVDDDVVALSAARAVLSNAGYTVAEALNGCQAFACLVTDPPDVLVTEVLMPDGDGIELISAVKRVNPDLPILVLSGRRFLRELDLIDLASKLGADAVLDKPFGAETLLLAIQRLIARSGEPSEDFKRTSPPGPPRF